MRLFGLLPITLLIGCGAIVDGSSSKGSSATPGDGGGSGTGSGVAPGCPNTPPTGGQGCIDGSYYCFYYPSVDAVCATAWKCTSKGTPPWSFYGGEKNCYETLRADRCAEGLACDSVEPRGGCVVACERKCTCDGSTGKLKCTAIAC
jgi:hypothetical protein